MYGKSTISMNPKATALRMWSIQRECQGILYKHDHIPYCPRQAPKPWQAPTTQF